MTRLVQFSKKADPPSQKLLNSIKLLLVQSKIFGFVTFNETTLAPSRLHSTLNSLAVLIYLPAICYSIYTTAAAEDPLLIYKATDIIILTGNGVYMAAAWVCATTKRHLLVDFLSKLVDFDTQLQKMGATIDYRKCRRRITAECAVRGVLVSANISALAYIAASTNADMLVESMAYILIVLNSVLCHQSGELVLMLKCRFAILNRQIASLVRFFRKSEARAPNADQLLALSRICALHHHLSKLVGVFNEAFGLVLLLMVAVSFVVVVITLFYLNAIVRSAFFDVSGVANPILANVSFVVNVVYVCDACYWTIEEVNRTGELIHRIDTEDDDVRDEIEMFSLQMANEQVEFNGAGFFAINYTLIFSILGGVTTYIIILIQLSNTLAAGY